MSKAASSNNNNKQTYI